MSINKVILTGRLTADPELKQTQNGTSVTQFTLAVSRPYQKDKQQESDFISVVAWRNTAEFACRNFSKGDPMEICGALRTRSYDDRRYPDVKHYVTEVLADNIDFTQSKRNASGNSTSGESLGGDLNDFEEVISDNELPF